MSVSRNVKRGCRTYTSTLFLGPMKGAGGALSAGEPSAPGIELDAKNLALRLAQGYRASIGFDRAALAFAAPTFTRPVCVVTCGAEAIDSHPGSPWRMRSASLTGLMW